ncbi:hypothetical protein CALCODRAFT_481491 [Calocera cornea HHB12733]|uniref:Uncharacterized protein n=1 Tax=Calocera cornea HHB12733 TaxID=1353952 RepID=A0A165HQE9_9BASI|nr:hypothetical protein CALCODRAFT_481491 [Calocera cornea HHB12733]
MAEFVKSLLSNSVYDKHSSVMSTVDPVDNSTLSPSQTSIGADGGSLNPAPDWMSTIAFTGDVQQAIAPFVDFFKVDKSSPAPTSKEDASSIGTSATGPAAQLEKKGKGPAKVRATRKANKILLVAGEASGEKSGTKKSGDGAAGLLADQLLRAYEARYGEGAVWTQERLKELLAGDKISQLVPQLVLAPAPDESSPASEPEDASADEAAEEDIIPAGDLEAISSAVSAAEPAAPADNPASKKTRREKIEELVLSRMDNPDQFDRSRKARIDVRKATEAQMIAEKVRVAGVGEYDGIVAALMALEEQQEMLEGALGRVREGELEESYQVGRRVGWDKTIAVRQKEFEQMPLEDQRAELERRKLAEGQLELEARQRDKQAGQQKRAKKFAKVKAKGKELVWTYGGKVLEVGATVALQALLKKFGVDEPEKVVREVFGLGKALQGVDGVVRGGGEGGEGGAGDDEDDENIC